MFESTQRESASAVRFGDYELDPRRGVLSRNGIALKLQPQPFRVLELLIARAPNIVTREEISDYVWGDGVYVDLDQSLNFCIRQIRSVLNDSASNPKFVDTLPKQGYRFIESVVELPAEISPASPKQQSHPSSENRARRIGDIKTAPTSNGTSPVQHPSPGNAEPPSDGLGPPSERGVSQSRNSRPLVWLFASAALVLLIIAVSLGVRSPRNRFLNRTGAPKITSLAVLPLDNLSGDPGQNYFADGMTDELTTMLAKNSTLRIVSRTSAMQYKGAHRPLPEIARELGVDGVLEGSIARTGDKVHMTIQLIQAPTDTHIWAESYDRNANDVVTLPKEAARTIAKRLASATLQPPPARYINPEAHDDYLRGRYIWFTGGDKEADRYFRKAIELQPDYAIAWAGLCMNYGQRAVDGSIPSKDALAQSEAAALKAVELDDSLPEAHLALWSVRFLNSDFAQAEQEIVRALELNPNYAEAWHFRAEMNATLGRYEEAVTFQKKATELDPFARSHAMGMVYLYVRQYDAAINDMRTRLETVPDDIGLHWGLHEAYRSNGSLKEAAQEWETVQLLFGDKAQGISAKTIRSAFEKGGYRAVLLKQLSYLKQKSATQYVSPYDFALVYAQLHQREETTSSLEEAYRQHSAQLLWLQTESAYDFLHADERYRSLIKKIGLPPLY